MRIYAHFQTDDKECPYLHDRPSRLDAHLVASISAVEHEQLLSLGVRHFGRFYFRPACPTCSQCISLRVPVAGFRASRAQRRVLSRNRDLVIDVSEPRGDAERIELYRRFHAEREAKRGWAPTDMDATEYVQSFVDSPITTLEVSYRLAGRLVAVAYVDETPQAWSSVFGFWEPELKSRGLGTFDVLTEISEALRRGKQYLYLGYYVRGCLSLEYKRTFRPCELLRDGQWIPDDEPPAVVGSKG